MRKALFFGSICLLGITSCENLKDYDDDIVFKVENGIEYKYNNVELYDSSTHIFCFKTSHPEFKTENDQSFEVLADGEVVYEGVFFPAYFPSLPAGPYIYCYPASYQNYALRIDLISRELTKDLRNDPKIISALRKYGLLHSGLSEAINSININGSQLAFRFTITNKDQDDLYIIDPEKTGPNLFHYFTNGLTIRKLTNEEVFSSSIQVTEPSPWNNWNMDWLSILKSGASRQFTINYTLTTPIAPGEYIGQFDFPGLTYQVAREQLYQSSGRIWLGSVQSTKIISLK